MKFNNMLDKFQFEGVFWFGSNKADYFPGSLSYSPDKGILLTVFRDGNRSIEALNEVFQDHGEIDVIQGSLIGKGYVTLLGANNINSNTGLGLFGMGSVEEHLHTFSKDTYQIDFLFIGDHIENPDSIDIQSVSFQSSYLDIWNSLFSYISSRNISAKERAVSFSETYPSVNAHIDKIDSDISFTTVGYFQSQSLPQKKNFELPDLELFHEDFIRLTPNTKHRFKWYLDQIQKLQRFFSFCINRPIFIHKLNLYSEINAEKYIPPIQVIYRQPGIDKIDKSIPDNMLIDLNDIKEHLAFALDTFFRFHDELDFQPVFELFASQYYYQDTNLINQFLNICQALETYHRKKQPDSYYRNPQILKEYLTPVEETIKSLPSQFKGLKFNSDKKKKISSSLYKSNTFSLLDRFNQLTHSEFSITHLEVPDPSYFNKLVSDTRNYYTHYELGSKIVLEPSQLYIANIQLKLWLSALLSKCFGIDEEKIIYRIKKSHYYSILSQNSHLIAEKNSQSQSVNSRNKDSYNIYIHDYLEQNFHQQRKQVFERLNKYFNTLTIEKATSEKLIQQINLPRNLRFAKYYNSAKMTDSNFMHTFKSKWSLQGLDTFTEDRFEKAKLTMAEYVKKNNIIQLYFDYFHQVPLVHSGETKKTDLASFWSKFCHVVSPEIYPPLDNPIKDWLGLKKESFTQAFLIIVSAYQGWLDFGGGKQYLSEVRKTIPQYFGEHASLFSERTDMNLLDLILWAEANVPKPEKSVANKSNSKEIL